MNNGLIYLLMFFLTGLITACIQGDSYQEYQCTEYGYFTSGRIKDSAEVSISFKEDVDTFNYSRKSRKGSWKELIKINKRDSKYYFLKKAFEIDGESILVERVDNSLIAAVDGRAYYYFLEDGRPVLIKMRDWAINLRYPTNRKDERLINALLNDTTCFYNCRRRSILIPPTR